MRHAKKVIIAISIFISHLPIVASEYGGRQECLPSYDYFIGGQAFLPVNNYGVAHTSVCAVTAAGLVIELFPKETCASGAHTKVWATHCFLFRRRIGVLACQQLFPRFRRFVLATFSLFKSGIRIHYSKAIISNSHENSFSCK